MTEQDLINLRKLAEQQTNQRALKIKNRSSKQTHDLKLAESLSQRTKKLDEVKETFQKLGAVFKESKTEDNNIRALPNSSTFSKSMRERLGSLMNSHNSLKITQDEFGQANFLCVPIQISGGDRKRLNENVYDLTREIYTALSSTSYTSTNRKDESEILRMNIIVTDLGYTGIGGRRPNRKTFFTITLPKLVDEIQNETFDKITDDSDDLQGEGIKIIIPPDKIDIYTRLEVLLGLKLDGHNNTLTAASNLIDELYKRGDRQIEQQYRNAPDKFSTW